MNTNTNKTQKGKYIKPSKLFSFMFNVFEAFNVDKTENIILSKALLWADMVGRHTQGVQRIPEYCERVQAKGTISPCNPVFIKEDKATALLDGKHGFGQYLGVIGMNKAVNIAKNFGIGIVGIINSGHYGAGAYYVNIAAQKRMIGIALSNSFPKVAPYGGSKAVFGTNPFSFGAPCYNGENILIDFSTASVAGSTVREYIKKGKTLPRGIAINKNGQHITNPYDVSSGALLPFGGVKGYCLSLMIEILTGILTGGGYSHYINSIFEYDKPSNSCHLMIAINIEYFIGINRFYKRIEELLKFIKSSPYNEAVLYPGERRWIYKKQSMEKGVFLSEDILNILTEFTKKHNISLSL